MATIPLHQERVIDEKIYVSEKLHKLGIFCLGPVFEGLPSDEQARLIRQRHIMTLYEQVLAERIKAF